MKHSLTVAFVALLAAWAQPEYAHAADESLAVYVQGMGGSQSNNSGVSLGGFGVQAGLQVLFLEAYVSQTSFGADTSVTRAVAGTVFDVNFGPWELSLHLGVGAIAGSGDALLGPGTSGDQSGAVARVGLGLERDLGAFFAAGASLESETYSVKSASGDDRWSGGSSVFLSGHLKFELGI
ncbi:MAG: hypothetical protein SF187_27620 [Deltaproteobacteria bacterium]|nr:hypothetical protein [Deltaproteobacteria bacterium]